MVNKTDKQDELKAATEKEERKLRDLDKGEKQVRKEFKDGQPIEGGIKATEESIRRNLGKHTSRDESIKQILESQGLNFNASNRDLSPAGRRSKRYYIRKRIESGKPYIPQRVRVLGKRAARELGYRVWEVRNKERDDEELELFEESRELEAENKLRLVFKMLGGRMAKYIKKEAN